MKLYLVQFDCAEAVLCQFEEDELLWIQDDFGCEPSVVYPLPQDNIQILEEWDKNGWSRVKYEITGPVERAWPKGNNV